MLIISRLFNRRDNRGAFFTFFLLCLSLRESININRVCSITEI